MARSMRLFLIRHGETVDNVAQLYAGSRDSELTKHGYQQAARLGMRFQSVGLSFTHLFSSHLQRAVTTAGKLREAQTRSLKDDALQALVPDVVQLPVLVEQDFGSMEGKKWSDRPPDSNVVGKEHRKQEQKDTVGFVAVETKDSMARRADTFIDEHLMPFFNSSSQCINPVIAIVSHGIFLSILWKRLLLRLPPKSVALSPELQAIARPSLEHLGGWSNTGYLELHLTQTAHEPAKFSADAPPLSVLEHSSLSAGMRAASDGADEVQPVPSNDIPVAQQTTSEKLSSPATVAPRSMPLQIAYGWTTTILAINGKDHLKGLKRTGGGVGSSRHDASQKNIDMFFKRRKV
ncbi:histidine phosphatase superfamily [Pyrenochaeta sp. MPI-SDFR-AT-0127]|nr:histidine phosphatase superfamily [Pyrenochaeta sp. MPI-SDFR-AT-0127]